MIVQNIMQFQFEAMEVRSIVDEQGEPWFVAKDVASALGIGWTGHTLDNIQLPWKGVVKLTTPGGKQDVAILSEPAIYKLAFRSNKPEAERFTSWVAADVIPSIRKTGQYGAVKELTREDLAQMVLDEARERKRLEATCAVLAPKAKFFDRAMQSSRSIPMGEVAKVLGYKGIGRNTLFAILRDRGVLMRDNIPYQQYINYGWFDVIEEPIVRSGRTILVPQTLVTPKGMKKINDIFIQDRKLVSQTMLYQAVTTQIKLPNQEQ